jgi:hypothetical protein
VRALRVRYALALPCVRRRLLRDVPHSARVRVVTRLEVLETSLELLEDWLGAECDEDCGCILHDLREHIAIEERESAVS